MRQIFKIQKMTDVFRDLKMGQTIEMQTNHFEAPHSYARLIGIRVKTELKSKIKNGPMILRVTRIIKRKKKTVKKLENATIR